MLYLVGLVCGWLSRCIPVGGIPLESTLIAVCCDYHGNHDHTRWCGSSEVVLSKQLTVV